MWRNARAWAMYSPRRSFQESKLHGNTESPRIPRLNQGGSSGFNQGTTGFNHGPLVFNQGRTFTQGSSWRNHPRNQYNKEHKSQPPYQHPSQEPSHQKPTNIEELLIRFMQKIESHQKSTNAAIRNLEVQIANQLKRKLKGPLELLDPAQKRTPRKNARQY